jgi:hypothetical protein
MAFEPHEKAGSVRIEKLNQKNIAAQLVTKRVDSDTKQKNQQQNNPEEFETQEPAVRFDRRHSVASITKQAWKIKTWRFLKGARQKQVCRNSLGLG